MAQRGSVEKLLADNVKEILESLGSRLVYVTLPTRHPVQPWSREREWIQMGLPLELDLQRWSNDLLTSPSVGSPLYIVNLEGILRQWTTSNHCAGN